MGQVDINALVEKFGRRYNVDPDLIHAVIRQESNYDPFAVSRQGAMGLMQLVPETADRFGVQDVFDPAENVQGGVKFLRFLLDRYEGDSALTLAAYNAGEGAVEKYGGVPPYQETTDYVARITALYRSQQNIVSAAEADEGSDSGDHRKITSFLEPSGLIRFETQSE
jgi:soluble lytic murein transglycosylase-like protein